MHNSHSSGFQLRVTLYADVVGFSRLPNHICKQMRWMYFMEPEHLQGMIKGLVVNPGSRHMRQSGSLSSSSCLGV